MNKIEKLALQKLMVGYYIESIPDDCTKNVVYVLQGDGVYERRKNRLGTFTTKIADVSVPGLNDDFENGWELTVPMVPISLLGTAIAFFRKVYTTHKSEAFVQFFYDEDTQEYLLHCPKQTVSGASVKFERDLEFETPSRILVMEIHSHGNMDAFFSGTDNHDEKDDRFYGVVGKVTDFFPTMKLRLNMGSYSYEVEVDDIFDTDEEMYHAETFPIDWPEKIEKIKIEKKGKKNKDGLTVFPGQGRQTNFFSEDAFGTSFDPADLYNKYLSGDHLYSQYECVIEDVDNESYVKKDGKFWHVIKDKAGDIWTEVGEDKALYQKEDESELDQHNQHCENWRKEIAEYRKEVENKQKKIENKQKKIEPTPYSNPRCDWKNWKF